MISAKINASSALKLLARKAKAKDNKIPVQKTVEDTERRMREKAPRGLSSRKSADVSKAIRGRTFRRKGGIWVGKVEVRRKKPQAKAFAVSFGTKRHGIIVPFIQFARDKRRRIKIFNSAFFQRFKRL